MRGLLAMVVLASVGLGYWAFQIEADHVAGRFLDAESAVAREYRQAVALFGTGETVLYVAFTGIDPSDPHFLARLDSVTQAIAGMPGVAGVLSLANVPMLVREGAFLKPVPLYDAELPAPEQRARLFRQPFLRGLLLSADSTASAMLVEFDPAFNDRPERMDRVEAIEALAQPLAPTVALAGFPYVRTQFGRRISRESPLFTLLALGVALGLLFLMFRSVRAVVLPAAIVVLGIGWTLGLMAFFGQKMNVVTSVLPALLVIIGMANAIHLKTKFFDRFAALHDAQAALRETLHTVGFTTLLTCGTTALGFAVLLLSGSHLMEAFGLFAALGIMVLYGLSIVLIPLAYSHFPPPPLRPRLATSDRFAQLFDWLAGWVERHSRAVLIGALGLMTVGVLGLQRISSDIQVFSDFFDDDPVHASLGTVQEHFGGMMPMEVLVTAQTPGRFRTLAHLRRLEALRAELATLPPVGRALTATDLVKWGNQAYFGGNPAAYRLPSGFEMNFLAPALRVLQDSAQGLAAQLPVFMDSTLTTARIHLGVPDLGTLRMNTLADTVRARARTWFGPEEFDVTITGSAIITTRSGENLIRNLLVSLGVALLLISALMASLFRSAPLTLISLVPNVVPMLLVGGVMGFFGVVLKPSTALIFPLAFGIAVDDTIHFLAKYRLNRQHLARDPAIRATLRETGKAILFTSLVLMGGFLVFTASSFGGTVTLGALTALTLALALLANGLLLPALLFRFGPKRRPAEKRTGKRA